MSARGPRWDAVEEVDPNASGLARAGGFVFTAVRGIAEFVWVLFLVTGIGLLVMLLGGWFIGAVRNVLGLDRD